MDPVISLLKERGSEFDGCTIIVYPYATGTLFGNLCPDEKVWQSLNEKLALSKCVENVERVYVYRDSEFSVPLTGAGAGAGEGDDGMIPGSRTLRRTAVHAGVHAGTLITAVHESLLDPDSFPKLKDYHHETERKSRTFKFGSVSLHLIEEPTAKFVQVTFKYRVDQHKNLSGDLGYLNGSILQLGR